MTTSVGGWGSLDEGRHWHQWVHAPEQPAYPVRYACESCDESTTGCQECRRPLAAAYPTICDGCLGRLRQVLDATGAAIALVPEKDDLLPGVRAVSYEVTGSAGRAVVLPFGLDAVVDDLDRVGLGGVRTVAGLLGVLDEVAEDWAEHRAGIRGPSGLTDPDRSVSGVDDVVGWIREHLLWAAQNHPRWAEHRRVLTGVRDHARQLAGLTPVREAVPCVHCGGRIVREWTDDGLDDARVCQGCGLSWPDAARLAFASRQALLALPATHPDSVVTIDEARRVVPGLKRNTINQALKRDRARAVEDRRLPQVGTTTRGEATYLLRDLAALAPDRGRAATGD